LHRVIEGSIEERGFGRDDGSVNVECVLIISLSHNNCDECFLGATLGQRDPEVEFTEAYSAGLRSPRCCSLADGGLKTLREMCREKSIAMSF